MSIEAPKISIVNELKVVGAFSVILYEKDILEISWSNKVGQIEKQHIVDLVEIAKQMGNGRKMLFYISTIDFLNISSEARSYSSSEAGQEYTLANAVQVDNLAKKIAFNFFMKVNKPSTPTRAFTDREEAISWLLEFKNDN